MFQKPIAAILSILTLIIFSDVQANTGSLTVGGNSVIIKVNRDGTCQVTIKPAIGGGATVFVGGPGDGSVVVFTHKTVGGQCVANVDAVKAATEIAQISPKAFGLPVSIEGQFNPSGTTQTTVQ